MVSWCHGEQVPFESLVNPVIFVEPFFSLRFPRFPLGVQEPVSGWGQCSDSFGHSRLRKVEKQKTSAIGTPVAKH